MGEKRKTESRARYGMMANAILSGEVAPVHNPKKVPFKKAPVGGGDAVATAGNLFSIGTGAAKLGLNVAFAPRRTATAVRRGFEKDYEHAKKEALQDSFIEPLYYGLTKRGKERRNEEARELRREIREKTIQKAPQVYEEYLKNKPYHPQDVQPKYIPRGKRAPTDQSIKTSYKPEIAPYKPVKYPVHGYGKPGNKPENFESYDRGNRGENKIYEEDIKKQNEFLFSKPYKMGQGPVINKEKFGREEIEIRSIKPTPKPRYVPEKRGGSFVSNLKSDIKAGLSSTLYDMGRKEKSITPKLKKPSFGFIKDFDTSPGFFSDRSPPIVTGTKRGKITEIKPRYVPESRGNTISNFKDDFKTGVSRILYDTGRKEKPVSPKIKKPSFGEIDLDTRQSFTLSSSGKKSKKKKGGK